MEISYTVLVQGKGNVQIEFTSAKVLTLSNVYHVPEIRKNLVSDSLLNKNGFKLVFDADKFVLSNGGAFVGKSHLYEGMFKLNITNKISNSAYIAYIVKSSSSLWHNRLGHVILEECMIW